MNEGGSPLKNYSLLSKRSRPPLASMGQAQFRFRKVPEAVVGLVVSRAGNLWVLWMSACMGIEPAHSFLRATQDRSAWLKPFDMGEDFGIVLRVAL